MVGSRRVGDQVERAAVVKSRQNALNPHRYVGTLGIPLSSPETPRHSADQRAP